MLNAESEMQDPNVFHLLSCGSPGVIDKRPQTRMASYSNMIVIFPSTYDGKTQWSTSGIENVADFHHFVT